ncbi:hypothetical protein BDV95DRAFT_607722 [Massariosphaeria phaeospora]|uniref:Uncharacterized protein n=1 Tax=Massariosphaeria phaeospora TaxID=100035 RepID=A0A7C8MAM2_9PLEO|nr:hypothetical protein BDV95DRAFT_607722 [Massariosphaeria phaeospora]
MAFNHMFGGFADDFFDDSPAGMVTIHTGRTHFVADYNCLIQYFPMLDNELLSGCIYTAELAARIHISLQSMGIRYVAIHKAIRFLFGLCKPHGQIFQYGFGPALTNHLGNMLYRDINYPPHHGGLRTSRSHFLVLAFFAKETCSSVLAHGLIDFFYTHRRSIMRGDTGEVDEYLHQWAIAIHDLEHLISPEEHDDCIRYLAKRRDSMMMGYHNSGFRHNRGDVIMQLLRELLGGSGRGRHHNRDLRLYDMPRAITVPRMNHHNHPRLITPRFIPAQDPMMLVPHAPALMPPMGQFQGPEDEIESLQWRQDQLEQEVQSLKWGLVG